MEELHDTIALLLKEQRILSEEFKRVLETNGLGLEMEGEYDCGAAKGTMRRRGWRIKRKDVWGNDVETEVWL